MKIQLNESEKKWIRTDDPNILFEENEVGRLKKEVWDMTEDQLDEVLLEYGIPSAPELGVAGTYIQNTPRAVQIEKRRRDDIVFVPLGCTENHGLHNNTGLDTFMCSQIVEGVRRYTKKHSQEVNLAFPPLNYGGHPYHHIGMPGTVIMPEEVVKETLIYTMLGLWNDGYRKIIFINNHGHLWMIESAIQEFCKRYQLPGIFRVIDWHRAVREFFYPTSDELSLETHFVHADEAETSVALLMFKEMVDMQYVQDKLGESLLPDGHMDKSVDPFRRPCRWSEGEGHAAIERSATPEGIVGVPSQSDARKAKRPIVAILKYLTLLHDQILDAYPAGTVPPVDKVSLRDPKEMEPFLKEPLSEGWKSIDELPRMGVFEHL
ncbi:3-dehydro-scyllo-inosose hydrolase [Extibacter muris]|uniref:3-dehydro-scyllo-inosose hydrolase n=1 Tax=Extibacter muris TaxID=1796622 RepID=UPI001D07BD07|nr:3-dehydro-scyllo-inosose hydrolase [Extibacter muris]MCB6201971.1 creatininase family protein [Extibacter muris]MCQ4663356.1 creatininase family protein [Extibacter muris]MCQ4692604.1 creatininase family protein [Extibacter muris]